MRGKKSGNPPTYASAGSSNEGPERTVAATSFVRSSELAEGCLPIPGRCAAEAGLTRAHTAEHVQNVLALGKVGCVGSAAGVLARLKASTACTTVLRALRRITSFCHGEHHRRGRQCHFRQCSVRGLHRPTASGPSDHCRKGNHLWGGFVWGGPKLGGGGGGDLVLLLRNEGKFSLRRLAGVS